MRITLRLCNPIRKVHRPAFMVRSDPRSRAARPPFATRLRCTADL